MPTLASRQSLRREEEIALARRLIELQTLGPSAPTAAWNVAALEHRPTSVGCTLVAAETRTDKSFRIDIAEVSGLNSVAGALAAQCCLESLRRSRTADVTAANRHFLKHPAGEQAMLAAGALDFDTLDSTWTGVFAGLRPPIAVDSDGRVELLRGSGPFLGLTETTFPILHGRLPRGSRLFLLAGSGAGEVMTNLISALSESPGMALMEAVEKCGSQFVADLGSGLGLTLVGIERNALSVPARDVE